MTGKKPTKVEVGTIYSSNSHGDCIVIEYKSAFEVYVKFLNSGSVSKVAAGNLRKGLVRDFLGKTVFGVGYFGVGPHLARYPGRGGACTKEYNTWNSMMMRCYGSNRDASMLRNYGDCIVCDEWHNYQTFADWCQTQPEMLCEGSSLDKDILVKGNREYSPENCCFVPSAINTAVTSAKHTNTTGSAGVWNQNGSFVAEITLCGEGFAIGSFDTLDKAAYMRKSIKEAYIRGLAYVHKDKMSAKAYEQLKDWSLH